MFERLQFIKTHELELRQCELTGKVPNARSVRSLAREITAKTHTKEPQRQAVEMKTAEDWTPLFTFCAIVCLLRCVLRFRKRAFSC